MQDPDVDARFAEIVAHWDAEPADPRPARVEGADAPLDGPQSPHAAPPNEPAADPAVGSGDASVDGSVDDWPGPGGAGSPSADALPPVGAPAGSAWRAVERDPDGPELMDDLARLDELPSDDGDDHFEPPEVQLPPQEDLHYWGAVGGLVLGPLLLLYVVFGRPFYSGWWLLASFTLMIGGFVLLVLRQPKDRDDNDDGVRL